VSREHDGRRGTHISSIFGSTEDLVVELRFVVEDMMGLLFPKDGGCEGREMVSSELWGLFIVS
jgi:hypothetical protein